jgi:hypothetical protein
MAEGSYSLQPENSNVEDMDEGGDQVREEEMVGGNDYEEFGAFGGYGTLTSFDIRFLRAFGSMGPGLRILSVRPLLGPLLVLDLVPCEGEVDEGESWPSGEDMPSFPKASPFWNVFGCWEATELPSKHDASVYSFLPLPSHALWPCRMSPGKWKTLCWPGPWWRHCSWIQTPSPMRQRPGTPI